MSEARPEKHDGRRHDSQDGVVLPNLSRFFRPRARTEPSVSKVVWPMSKFRFVISEKSSQISRNFWAVTTCEEPYHNSKISSNFEL